MCQCLNGFSGDICSSCELLFWINGGTGLVCAIFIEFVEFGVTMLWGEFLLFWGGIIDEFCKYFWLFPDVDGIEYASWTTAGTVEGGGGGG